ncbi:hypothetical protein CR513_24736, partial [Mucuna pruriens]
MSTIARSVKPTNSLTTPSSMNYNMSRPFSMWDMDIHGPFPMAKEQLTFGVDTMIPVEIREPSLRRISFYPIKSPYSLRTNPDLVEEVREQAYIRQEAYR